MSTPTILRAALAERLSAMYAAEVPKYGHLVDATTRVNAASTGTTDSATGDDGLRSARLGAERHGAVRVASFAELAQMARLFRCYGMQAVGFYDLRTSATPIPVVSTAFRPIDPADMAASPFRMFTSTLVADDQRFFSPALQAELARRVADRQLFSAELTALLDQIDGGLHRNLDQSSDIASDITSDITSEMTNEFVDLTVDVFRLNTEPLDAKWHDLLDQVSPVASDIAAAAGTHLNHLTPRVTDIEALHALMEAEGVTMIDRIQGPPSWDGPDVLLRQTSFRALDEPRVFLSETGKTTERTVRVRFGEVEQRGIALTRQGREKVDRAMLAGDDAKSGQHRTTRIRQALNDSLSPTLLGLATAGDAYVEFKPGPNAALVESAEGSTGKATIGLNELLEAGVLTISPLTYEDFLPSSAAGIFASNLSHRGAEVEDRSGRDGEAERLLEAVGTLHDPYRLYEQQQAMSLTETLQTLGILQPGETPPESATIVRSLR